jgi:hypothetical protein
MAILGSQTLIKVEFRNLRFGKDGKTVMMPQVPKVGELVHFGEAIGEEDYPMGVTQVTWLIPEKNAAGRAIVYLK